MTDSAFRGLQGIEEIQRRMGPLMHFTKTYQPSRKSLRLSRKDYDLIKRWPKAANSVGITVLRNTQGGVEIWWQGIELIYATSQGRYEKIAAPVQTDVEHP